MRDLAFVFFLVALLGFGIKRPFLLVLGYVYIDIVSPQRLSYYLLNLVPISQIFFIAALLGWLLKDDKTGTRMAKRQWVLLALLGWCGFTTLNADFPVEAIEKWDWVSKVLIFAIFLPLTLRTRLRMESLLLFVTLSGASIIIIGAIKTILSGGGYGVLNLGVDNNSGLYESSIISTFAIALIPIILYLARHGTIFPRDWRVHLRRGADLRLPAHADRHRGPDRPGLHGRARRADAPRYKAPLALYRRCGTRRDDRGSFAPVILHPAHGHDRGL